jgi:hypothetical protein
MKTQGCILYKILGLALLLTVGTADAQIGGDILKVKIPFNVTVGTQIFPADEYSLKPLLSNTLLLRNRAGEVLTSVATNSVESREAPSSVKLVFSGYGGPYFLAQIWQAGDSTGWEVQESIRLGNRSHSALSLIADSSDRSQDGERASSCTKRRR